MTFALRGRALAMLFFAVVTLGITFFVAKPAEAAPYTCPTGWFSVTKNPISNVSTFCYLYGSGGILYNDNIHVIKADYEAVGQYTRFSSTPSDLWGAVGHSGDPNPAFMKKPVADHLDDYLSAGIRVVINGTFFECIDGCSDSELSFPTFRVASLANAGVNVGVPRSCIAWGITPPQTYSWTDTNTTWSDVGAAQSDCGWAYHQVVGLDPTVDLGVSAKTYVAHDLSADPAQLCFAVGGSLSATDVIAHLATFGCEGAVQMDGGSSSQLSYIDPDTNQRKDPVEGSVLYPYRPVPHYFVIWGS